MRRYRLSLSVLILAGIVSGSAARAVGPDGFGTLDAALPMAEVGLQEARSDLILSAIEVVAELSPGGAEAWIAYMEAEARILARGDRNLIARADAISRKPGVPGLQLVPLEAGTTRFALAGGRRLARVRTPVGWTLDQARAGPVCPLSGSRISDCASAGLSGSVTVTAREGQGPAFLAFETPPVDDRTDN